MVSSPQSISLRTMLGGIIIQRRRISAHRKVLCGVSLWLQPARWRQRWRRAVPV